MSMATQINANPNAFNTGAVPPNEISAKQGNKFSSEAGKFAGFNAANSQNAALPQEDRDAFIKREVSVLAQGLLKNINRDLDTTIAKIRERRATSESAGSQPIDAIPNNLRKPLMTYDLEKVPLFERHFSPALRKQLDGIASHIRAHNVTSVEIDGYGAISLAGKIRADQVNDYLSYQISPSLDPIARGHNENEDPKRAAQRVVTVSIYGPFKKDEPHSRGN